MIANPRQPVVSYTAAQQSETASLLCSAYHRLGRDIQHDVQEELSSPVPNEPMLRSALFETVEQLSPSEQDMLLYSRNIEASHLCQWWQENKHHYRDPQCSDTQLEHLVSILEREFTHCGFEMNPIYQRVLRATAVLLMDTDRGVLPRAVLEDSVAQIAGVDTLYALMVLQSALPKAQSIWTLSLAQAVGTFEFSLQSSWSWLRRHAEFVDSHCPDSPGAVILAMERLGDESIPSALRPVFSIALQADVHHLLIRKEV